MGNTLTLDLNRRYTYADYLTWLDDKRRELVNGFIRMMSPAPGRVHQQVSYNLTLALGNRIKKHKGKSKVYFAPFDVRLPQNGETSDDKIYTVVQPDLCVICDLAKLDDRGCLGAPDLVAEVQSASTARYDLTRKFDLYEAAGVREYWIVYPYGSVEVFLLQPDGKYGSGVVYDKGQKIPVSIFDDIEVDLNEVFEF
ncbi:MAG: Uma2 family endonuclease [Prevotellaceae bacterium]|jgi:Uma2 family endonuclease|nr:Uma2 family endonuclease [Prevotellaceae bacterium]